jgi:hypothetical protein
MIAVAVLSTAARATRASTAWRTLVGICLLLSPVLGFAEHLLDPRVGLPRDQYVAAIAAQPDQRLLDVLVGLAGGVLFVPIVLGLVHLLRAYAPVAALVGGGLAIIGQLAQTALYGVDLSYVQMVRQGIDPATIAELMAGLGGSTTGVGLLLAVVLGLVVGTLVLAVSLWRTRVVPRPAAALIVAFVVGDTIGVGANSLAVYLIAHTFLLVGSGWIGLRVLRMSDAEWGSPPR